MGRNSAISGEGYRLEPKLAFPSLLALRDYLLGLKRFVQVETHLAAFFDWGARLLTSGDAGSIVFNVSVTQLRRILRSEPIGGTLQIVAIGDDQCAFVRWQQ